MRQAKIMTIQSDHPTLQAARALQSELAARAAEMEEVAKMLADLGLPSDMASSTVNWQRRLAESRVEIPPGDTHPDHEWFSRAILEAFGNHE